MAVYHEVGHLKNQVLMTKKIKINKNTIFLHNTPTTPHPPSPQEGVYALYEHLPDTMDVLNSKHYFFP